ncbi:hypothetical protein [Burkholderia sp. Bp8992]|uniref:hypothetical protein n=1 Tax=Burkholderia sp. Bp8992 TaxID=2184554 RepID=UPI000F55A466|nr:hypothetical protein [Burkholderia sp. Bp8992]
MNINIKRGCSSTSLAIAVSAVVFLSGCASSFIVRPQPSPGSDGNPRNSASSAGAAADFDASKLSPPSGYQPLDPAPVAVRPIGGKTAKPEDILNALPDETMRLAIGQIDTNGNVTYGPVSMSVENGRYVVTVDYIKSNTYPLFVKKTDARSDGSFRATFVSDGKLADLAVPVYIGVGLRVTATLNTTKAGVNLGNLIAIGAAAQASQLSGTLVVQTLGLTGENISTALPIPSDISLASIQSAIQALGTMKAKLYDTSKTHVEPRVVGVYNNIGASTNETINGIISGVLAKPLPLDVPVEQPTKAKVAAK